jgi:hypothetical protein
MAAAQLEMWKDEIQIEAVLWESKRKLDKIHRNTQGLFKRINELQAEAEIISVQIEEIIYDQFYSATKTS